MGFLSSLAGLFTGAPGVSAAKKSAAATTKYATQGAQAASAPIYTGETQAQGYLGTSMVPWQTIFGQGQPAVNTYYGALGIGDPSQIAAAQSAFQASPAYQYTLGQGLEGLSRVGTSTGQLGEANMDAMKFAQNLSQQDYQQWLDNLSRGFGQETAGATGLTNIAGRQADVATGAAKDLSAIQTGKYNTIGQAQAALPVNVNAAQMGGAANALSAFFGLGNLAVGGLGGLGFGVGAAGPFMSNAGNIYYGG